MRCPNCQRDAVEDAVFCNHCGMQLQNICANCDTFNPLDSNFCSRCGLSLSSELQRSEAPAYQEPHRSSPVQSSACPRCHKANEPGSAYCYSCGLPMDEAEGSHQTSTAPSPSSTSTPVEATQPHPTYSKYAGGFWIRLAAWMIDVILIITVMFLVLFLFPVTADAEEAILGNWMTFITFLVSLIYYTIAVAAWSTTIGKRVFRLYVLRTDGSRVSFGRALARYFCHLLSTLTPLGIGFLMIASRKDKRGLHDLICDTMVVRR